MDEDLRHVVIYEAALEERDDLHELLAEGLGFPNHYGRNLDELNDCLSEVSDPSLVSVVRMRGWDDELPLAGYVDKACVCLMRAARENPALDVEIVFEQDDESY